MKVRFDRALEDELDDAMVSKEFVAKEIRRERLQPVPGRPGLVMCSFDLVVPRRSDPETARIRRVSLTMSDHDEEGIEVVRVDGLRGTNER